jgi:hypothetical protein
MKAEQAVVLVAGSAWESARRLEVGAQTSVSGGQTRLRATFLAKKQACSECHAACSTYWSGV